MDHDPDLHNLCYQCICIRGTKEATPLHKKRCSSANICTTAHLDELVIFEPGDIWFGVAEGNAGQHRFGFYQKGQVGRVAFDLWLWREEKKKGGRTRHQIV